MCLVMGPRDFVLFISCAVNLWFLFIYQAHTVFLSSNNIMEVFSTENVGTNEIISNKEISLKNEDDIFKNLLENRKELLKRECSNLGLEKKKTISMDKSTHFFINNQYHLVWCSVFKSASTTWLYNFNLMANYTKQELALAKENPLGLARKRYPKPTPTMIKRVQQDPSYITFMTVRHPFERLASVFNDKVLNPVPQSMYDNWGPAIISKFRDKELKESSNAPKRPLFKEFVDYVIDGAKRNKFDNHWKPYSDFCEVCSLNYDIIMKVETLDEDQKYFIKYANLTSILEPQWKNKGKIDNTSEVINEIYKTLTKEQIDRLADIYKYDLQLFGYTTNKYYDLLST